MKLPSKPLKIIAVILASLFMVTALIYYNFIDKAVQSVNIGDRAPEFFTTVYDREDGQFTTREKQISSNEYKGKVLIVNFWSTTCVPCMEELPHFDELQKEYKDEIVILALGNESGWDADKMCSWMNIFRTVKGMEDRGEMTEIYKWDTFDITFGFYTDNNDVGKKLGFARNWPSTAIIDQEGVIQYLHQGKMSYEQLETIVKPLLEDK